MVFGRENDAKMQSLWHHGWVRHARWLADSFSRTLCVRRSITYWLIHMDPRTGCQFAKEKKIVPITEKKGWLDDTLW